MGARDVRAHDAGWLVLEVIEPARAAGSDVQRARKSTADWGRESMTLIPDGVIKRFNAGTWRSAW